MPEKVTLRKKTCHEGEQQLRSWHQLQFVLKHNKKNIIPFFFFHFQFCTQCTCEDIVLTCTKSLAAYININIYSAYTVPDPIYMTLT